MIATLVHALGRDDDTLLFRLIAEQAAGGAYWWHNIPDVRTPAELMAGILDAVLATDTCGCWRNIVGVVPTDTDDIDQRCEDWLLAGWIAVAHTRAG